MALSFTKYLSAAGVNTYAVPFPFIDKSHVVVSVDGFSVPFEFTAAKTVRLLSPLPAGSKVLIRRATPREPLVSFGGASVLTDSELNLANKQSIYLSQELEDSLTGGVTGATAELEDLRLAVFSITSLLGSLNTAVNTISQRVGALSAGVQGSQSGAQPGEVRTFTTVPAGWTPLISTDEPAIEGVVQKSITRGYLRATDGRPQANRRIRGIFTTEDGLSVYSRSLSNGTSGTDDAVGGAAEFEVCRPFNYRASAGTGTDIGPIPAGADFPLAFANGKLFLTDSPSLVATTFSTIFTVDRVSKAATVLRELKLGSLRFTRTAGVYRKAVADVLKENGQTKLLFYTSVRGPASSTQELGSAHITYTVETNSFVARMISFETQQTKDTFLAIPVADRPVDGVDTAKIYLAINGVAGAVAPGSVNAGRIYDTPYLFYTRVSNLSTAQLSLSLTTGFAFFDKVDRNGESLGTYALNCSVYTPRNSDDFFLVQRINRSTFCFMRKPEGSETGPSLRVVTDLSPPGTFDPAQVSFFEIATPALSANAQFLGEENGVVYILDPGLKGQILAVQTGAAEGFNGILTTAVKNTAVPITPA